MEDTKIVVCRLCLNFTTFDECQILDTVSKDMLTFIMPEADLDISHDPKICQTCYKTMLRCYRFQSNYNKDVKTETKKKLDTEGSEIISIQVEEVENKCNFCSSSIDDESREEFNNRKTYFTEVLQKYLPERNLSSKALFCKKCLDDLTSQFTFITKCTDTENKLKHYRLTHSTNSEGKLNLYEALQQILCKEDTDLITAINTDGEMSCEDLFGQANNEVPFPEVDVNTETLKMEEVDIKSEPYDEESIITSESEGSITGSERHLGKSQAESFDFKESAAHDDYKDHSENSLNISQFNIEDVKFQQTSPLPAVMDELSEVKPKDHLNLDHNFIKEESPEVNDTKTELAEADGTEKNKKARRRNFCYFCKTAVSNFARHITKKHVTEIEVRKILLQPANSKERKILINTLRKKGNFFKNSAEVCINPMRKSMLPNRSYLPCPYCLGYYSAKLLCRHKKKCTEKLPSANYLNVNYTRTKNIAKVNDKKAGLTEDNKMEKNETNNQGHFCCFCETEVFNFARHITRNHRTQAEVQEILSKPTNTKERKILINILRKKGNFLKHSSQNRFKPMRKSMLPNKTYLPCPNCLGFYSAKLLYRHKKNCTGNSNAERISQSSAQNRLVAHLKIDKQLKELVFPRMRPDNVSLEAKKDALICAFGASYLNGHLKKHFINVISRKMRELSKILTEMKKMRPSIKNMFQALQPEYYDTLVEASKIVARYDTEKDIFGAPTLAMNISASLKHCCNVAISFALQKPRTDEAETKLKTTMQLLKTNWKFDMSICRVGGDSSRNKLSKVTIVSLAGDLKLLKDYLEKVADEARSNVTNNNNDVEGYVTLLETVLCRTVLVNRRSPKLLQKIPLRTYEQCENTEQSMDEYNDTFSRLEKILRDKFKCVVIRGKRGRVVPVLICTDTQEHIKILIESRPNFVGKENPYLFGMPNLKIPICGYAILEKYAKACGATKHKSITSRPLRKYVATLSQLFLMDKSEVERLANFMGRSIHSSHDDVHETAKLSKFLLLMESGDASEYKGKSLDEIEIDLEEDLLEDDSDSSGESDDDIISYNDLMPRREPKTPPPVIKKQKRVLVPWSAEQKKIVKEFFKSHIKHRKPPKRGECDELVSRYPELKRTVDDADGSPSTKRCRTDKFQACSDVPQTKNTETNIAKEHGFTPFKKHRQYTPLLEDFIENDRNQIRRIVHSFFLRHEQPTVEKIQAVLSENEHLPPLSNIILMRVLNEINFRIKGKRQCKFIKERDETIIWRRRYLTQIKAYREEQRPIYYLDEMSIYVVQDSKGKSFTVLHICSEDGFLTDGLLMFESKVVEDQNKKIKIAAFEDWFPKILPKLKDKAVIVLHNGPCHSRPLEEFPNGTMHKVEIQKWLSSKNIAFEEDMVKLELLDLVKKAKPLEKRYVVDEMAKANNKNVLRLPPYHYELNPLKTIWPQIKSEVSSKNSSCEFEEVREALVEAIARVSAEQWQKAISDVLEVEKELWQLDIDMEEQMEAILADCSGTESESESD